MSNSSVSSQLTNHITFDEFKKMERSADGIHLNEIADETEVDSHANKPVEPLPSRDEVLSKLFRRRKNYRVRKLDDVEGPLYTDPFIAEKLKNPKKC